jgi:hypothetical protein
MWADGSEPVGGLLDSFGFLSSTPVDHSSACCISCLHLDVGTDAAFLAAGFPRNSMSNGTALQQRAFHRVQARRELDTEMDPRMKRPVAVRCLPRRRSSPRSATAGSARSHGVTLPGRSHNCANDRSSIARAELNTLPIRGQGQNRSIFHA